MTETATTGVSAPDAAIAVDGRERAALIAFVTIAVVATLSWLVLLGWLVLVGLRAVGI